MKFSRNLQKYFENVGCLTICKNFQNFVFDSHDWPDKQIKLWTINCHTKIDFMVMPFGRRWKSSGWNPLGLQKRLLHNFTVYFMAEYGSTRINPCQTMSFMFLKKISTKFFSSLFPKFRVIRKSWNRHDLSLGIPVSNFQRFSQEWKS